MSWNVKCQEMSNVMKSYNVKSQEMSWNIKFHEILMLDLWPQAETPGVTHFGAYHRPPDGHFYLFHRYSFIGECQPLLLLFCADLDCSTLLVFFLYNSYVVFFFYITFLSTSVYIQLVLLMYCNVTKCNMINMRSPVQWSVIILLCLIFFRSFFVM